MIVAINEQTNGQGSALNAAARNGNDEMVAFLIEKGLISTYKIMGKDRL